MAVEFFGGLVLAYLGIVEAAKRLFYRYLVTRKRWRYRTLRMAAVPTRRSAARFVAPG